MANSKVVRNPNRARRRRPARAAPLPAATHKAAASGLKSIPAATLHHCTEELARILLKLERLRRVITTAFLALKHQNAERDWDVASTLQFSVTDPIFSIEEDGWKIVSALGGDGPGEDMS
jgi:hypothetical protein